MKHLRFFLRAIAVLLFFLSSMPGNSQTVRLNEICPSNVSGLLNSNGQYDDWIEIHNPTTGSQSINGWGLSDDPLQPFKFTFPNISLAANQHIVIFAADTNITSVATNWKCAAGSNGWSTYSASTPPSSSWTTPGFNAANWTTKTVPMGYGSNYSSIVTSSGTISGTPLAVALRKTFTLTDTSKITAGAIFLDYDDGYVLYLNGVEISRANFVGAGGWNDTNMTSRNANIVNSISTARDPDSIYLSKAQLSQLLVVGTNVISMEVHTRSTNDLYAACYLYFGILDNSTPFAVQSAPNYLQQPTSAYSADFKMSRMGETIYLTDSSGVLMDSYAYGFTDSDDSWGRCANGSVWNLFATPSPTLANPSGSYCCIGYTPPPVITPASGFYSGSVSVSCLPSSGTSFTYTTNGDVPQTSSRSFSGPVTLNTSTTIRARAFKANYLPSRVVTNTYFINTDIQLPIFTITTDSLNLWDWNTGIYVMGPNASSTYPYFGANFWQDWKKPAHIEFFDKQKNKLFDFDAEINIDGNYTQAKPQKSFAISLGDRFGLGSINYNFITDKPFIDNTKDIVLRNMGNDWNKCHLRDPFMERMMKDTWSGYVSSEPVVLFLNGEFWGVYSFHELDNSTWIKNNFGLKSGEFDYLKESGSSIDSGMAYSGSLFFDIYNYTRTHDPSTTTYYNWINDHIDLQNYADYFICETYVNNDDWIGDWVNNIKMWNPRGPQGKLHYLMYDLDMGFGYGGLAVDQDRLNMARNPTPPAFSYSSEIFDTILYNPTFRRYFINRYADLMNSEYLRDSLNPILSSYKDSLAPDMPEQFQKWGNDTVYWENSITTMKNWYYRRTSYVRSHIQSGFGLTSQVTWTLDVNPPGAGRILVNTIIPPVYPWSGVYFNNNPVTITAIPNPGYTFDRWVSNTLGNTNTNRSVTVNYTQSQLTTAYFNGTPRTPLLYINEINYNSDSALDCGDWVEIHNKGTFSVDLSDWELRDQYDYHRYRIPVGTVIPPNSYLVLAEDMDKFGSIHPGVTNVIGPIGFNFSNSGDQIRLLDYRDSPIDSVYYQQFAPWPVLADGFGYTCERLTPPNNPYDGTNWFPGCYGGSPGRAYGATFGANMPVTGGSTFCAGDTLTLRVPPLSGALYQWYRNGAAISGATDSVYQTARSGDYSVMLTYQGCSARSDTLTVTQVTQNVAPVAAPAYRCGEGVLTLNATASDTVFWFTSSSGGTPIAFGDSLSTPYLLSSTTYYAQAGLNCPSQRTPVVAQILQHAADPVTQDTVSICGPGQVVLTATDTAAIRWYNAQSGGGLLGTGSTLTIPFVPNDTAFFVEAGTFCVSNRLQVFVEVYQAALPTVNSSSRCGDGPLVLMANSSDPLAWYDAAVGGTQVSTSSVFITPILTATTTYYVQSNGNCTSARVPVTATIYPIPPVPVVTDDTVCQPASIQLSALSPEQVMWYTAPAGGTLLNIGSQYTTPVLNATTTYYVESVSQTCNSARVPVTVYLFQAPVNFLGQDTVVASGTSLVLHADPNATMYIWNTGETTSSIAVTCGITNDSTGYYSVTCIYPGGCVASDQIRVDFSTEVENAAVPFVIQGLYPNPVKDVARLVLQARSRTSAKFEILDMAGRSLSEFKRNISRGSNSIELSFTNLAAGCYFIRVSSPDDANILYKVIVE